MSASSLIPPAVIHSTQSTFGAALIGTFIDIGIYGFATCQVYTYFINYSQDKIWTKATVLLLWLVATFHAIVTCHVLYHYLISNIFNPIAFNEVVWSLTASVAAHVVNVAIVLTYFASIVYKIAGKRAKIGISAALVVAICAHVGFGISVVYKLSRVASIQDISSFTRNGVMPMGISQLIADVLIAGSLCVLLNERRESSINKRTNRMLKTLMVYTLERCILTSLVAAIDFLAIAVESTAYNWIIGCEFVVNDLYVCSLLACLNARGSSQENQRPVLASDLNSFPMTDSGNGSTTRRNLDSTVQHKYQPFNSGIKSNGESMLPIQVRVDVDSFGAKE